NFFRGSGISTRTSGVFANVCANSHNARVNAGDKSFRFNKAVAVQTGIPRAPCRKGELTMVTLEVHPEVHAREQRQLPAYSTCHECHHTFHARSEDQLSLTLCDSCFEDLRSLHEPIISVHVKPRMRRFSGN